jgi:hypothetical protein
VSRFPQFRVSARYAKRVGSYIRTTTSHYVCRYCCVTSTSRVLSPYKTPRTILNFLLSSSSSPIPIHPIPSTYPKLLLTMSTVNEKISDAETILGHEFLNRVLCVEALQMAAPKVPIVIDGSMHRVEANKRLAVVGDAILSAVLSKLWYEATDQAGNSISSPELYFIKLTERTWKAIRNRPPHGQLFGTPC